MRLPRPNRRSLAALVAVVALVGAAHLLDAPPVVRYAAWLVAFAVWMAWFVAASADRLSDG